MNGATKAYITLVGLGGLLGLSYGWLSKAPGERVEVLIVLVSLGALAQTISVPLFTSSSVSLAFAISFIALLLFGPFGAVVANLGSALTYALYPVRRVWYKIIFNASVFTISAAIAGGVYALTGGAWSVQNIQSAAIPSAAAAIAYFLANTVLVSLAVSLSTATSFRKVFDENHRWLGLHYVTVAAISLMAALGFQSMGWPGLLAFLLPLLMPWVSTRMYIAQTKNVLARNAELTEVNARLAEANANLQRRIEEMDAFYRTGLVLNGTVELREMLAYVVESVRALMRAHGVAVFVYDRGRKTLSLGCQSGLRESYAQAPELSLNGPAFRAINERRRFVLDGDIANSDLLSRAAAEEGVVAAACLPLSVGDEVVGVLDVTFIEPHVFSNSELTVLETFAEQAAAGIHSAALYKQVHSAYLSTIAVLVATVEAKDPYTRGHSERVRDLAIATGTRMGLPPDDLNTLELAALFHDIGKIGIPENVLGKDGPLTEEERELVRRHPALAESILKHVPTLAETIPIIRSHHERPDGSGYPDGLDCGTSRLSAIIAVVDAFDAMVSDRPYRKALTRDYAIGELRAGAGSQFDAAVVDAFIKAIDERKTESPPLVSEVQFRRDGVPTAIHCPKSMSKQTLS
ncbi:MAG: GAF domain-containing protein [Chloroflexi bacterium]|nr:GAF domain-containing protein [Chloroflexota bacterium]